MRRGFVALAAVALLLPACGFTPLYSTETSEEFSRVAVAPIPNEEGIALRNALIDRLHARGAGPEHWRLTCTPVAESITDLGITKSADATRGQMRLSTTMTLTDAAGGEVLRRNLRAVMSYNILASEFTNRVSQDAARTNAIEDLARQIEESLALHFAQSGAAR